MPPRSKSQARFMRAAAAGDVESVDPKMAQEFVDGFETSDLPEKVGKKTFASTPKGLFKGRGKAKNGPKKARKPKKAR